MTHHSPPLGKPPLGKPKPIKLIRLNRAEMEEKRTLDRREIESATSQEQRDALQRRNSLIPEDMKLEVDYNYEHKLW